jgi:hypothetical protein
MPHSIVMLYVIMLSVVAPSCYAQCHYAECHNVECCGTLKCKNKKEQIKEYNQARCYKTFYVYNLQMWVKPTLRTRVEGTDSDVQSSLLS